MDYGKLVSRAVTTVWENKFLIVLGILVALGGGGGSGGASFNFDGGDFGQGAQPQTPPDFPQIPQLPPEAEVALGGAALLVLLLCCVAVLVGLVLFVLSTVARGGLIAGVNDIEEDQPTSLGQAWSAGWQRVWTLLGIAILPAIPSVILVSIGLILGVGVAAFSQAVGVRMEGLLVVLVPLACVLIPITLVLTLLRTFANRAAMLEGLGVMASYGRGWSVLLENVGSAIIIFVIQILAGIVITLLLIPGALLLCLFWPVAFILQGALSAIFSALWTLAWREWTGLDEIKAKAAPVA